MTPDFVVKHTLWSWKSTVLAISLAGCIGCEARSDPEDSATVVAPPTPAPVADQISAVSEAEGKTLVILPPRPDLHPGDILHVRDGEHLIATALVTASDEHQATATIVALSDRRRPVMVADRVAPAPADQPIAPEPPPATADEARIARDQAATRLALAAVMAPAVSAPPATAAPLAPDPTPAPKLSSAERETLALAAPAAAVTAVPLAVPPAPAEPVVEAHAEVVAPSAASPSTTSSSTLEPTPISAENSNEVRARLEAERAYYELAARVLRLPHAGPELLALQERLRQELVGLGQQP